MELNEEEDYNSQTPSTSKPQETTQEDKVIDENAITIDNDSENSDSYDEFESSDQEVVLEDQDKPGIEDYIEISRSKGDPVPSTRKLGEIPADKLAPFRLLYEQQPQKVKEMIRLNFYKGKPVIKPQPLSLFASKIQGLTKQKKLQKQREKKEENEKLKKFRALRVIKGDKEIAEAKINLVDVNETDTQLIHVDYPGRVVNVEKAISTMGGINNITKVFNNDKKLQVKFRPEDPYCNSTMGEPRSTVGLLLKVRRRKPKPLPEPIVEDTPAAAYVIDLENENESASVMTDDSVVNIKGVPISKYEILKEDKRLLREATKDSDFLLEQYHNTRNPEQFIKIPKNHKPKIDQEISLISCGIVKRSYQFDGICDFQFLPMKKTLTGVVSTRDKVLPLIGKPSENINSLFVGENLLNRTAEIERALVPPMMSRIDKPQETVIEHFLDSDKIKLDSQLKKTNTGVISTTRTKRNVYTLYYNFQTDRYKKKSEHNVPSEPLQGALDDVNKRRLGGVSMAQVTKCFEERPIWSKAELEHTTQLSSHSLKYVLPCVSYFANNGPWRALWLRLGFDPRDKPFTFLYQTVDFRVPAMYKQFMDDGEKLDEDGFIFRPNSIPPRAQMFYQICNVKCDEVEKLIKTASEKESKKELSYNTKFGWLKEGTFDYIRHVLIQKLEIQLEQLGKIPKHPTKEIHLASGELETHEKLVSRPRQAKRIRKVQTGTRRRKFTDHPISETTEVPSKAKGKKVSKSKAKESTTTWAYQGILQDLSIKDINTYNTGGDDFEVFEDDIGDDSLLISDEEDAEEESTTEESEEEFEYDDDDEGENEVEESTEEIRDDSAKN